MGSADSSVSYDDINKLRLPGKNSIALAFLYMHRPLPPLQSVIPTGRLKSSCAQVSLASEGQLRSFTCEQSPLFGWLLLVIQFGSQTVQVCRLHLTGLELCRCGHHANDHTPTRNVVMKACAPSASNRMYLAMVHVVLRNTQVNTATS
jgi:hypothetical protein